MSSFEITGGNKLSGEIIPQGAKNEALQVIAAVLLTTEPVTISNIPDIADVNNLIDLLKGLGVQVDKAKKKPNTYTFQAENIDIEALSSEAYQKKGGAIRGSIMLIGPLLTRDRDKQELTIPKPGGDKIGRRRLDTHLLGFEKLGATFDYGHTKGLIKITCKELKGANLLLEEASVTGTANLIMAAVLAKGCTTIYNAACEPYIQQLCKMLNRMGAKITGIGSNLLKIQGVTNLTGTKHRLLPDMIEVGSFIGLAAMTGSALTIKDAGYKTLGIIPNTFKRLGIHIQRKGKDIYVPEQSPYEIETFIDGSILTLSDAPWPGLTPDLLSVLLVVATQAKGNVLIHQKMFESRLFFTDKLIDMGAQVILCDPHRATVIGLGNKQKLRGISMTSPDIRAGVALLIAALSAEGASKIHNIEQIDRGYQQIEKRLEKLGANIKRITSN